MCDIILRMPLSLFLQLVCLNYKVDGLDDYINHPVKKHYLVKTLPEDMKQKLLYARKYIASISDDMSKLCYMGLTQFGPNIIKDKDQIFVYVNTKGSLLDTRSSEPGYHQIEDKSYTQIKVNIFTRPKTINTRLPTGIRGGSCNPSYWEVGI
jgi:general transcription factor 3C polypeptide 1